MKQVFEMAKLTRQKSGQDFDIWVESAGKGRNTKHNCIRVKAINNDIEIVAGFDSSGNYTTFKTPNYKLKQFGKAKELEKYLIKIQPLLELHWEGKMDDGDFINAANFVRQGYEVLDAVDKAITMWGE